MPGQMRGRGTGLTASRPVRRRARRRRISCGFTRAGRAGAYVFLPQERFRPQSATHPAVVEYEAVLRLWPGEVERLRVDLKTSFSPPALLFQPKHGMPSLFFAEAFRTWSHRPAGAINVARRDGASAGTLPLSRVWRVLPDDVVFAFGPCAGRTTNYASGSSGTRSIAALV